MIRVLPSRRFAVSQGPAGRSPVSRHAALVFWVTVLVLWGMDTHGNFAGTGDEPHYAMIAHSLVFDRDFDLGNDYAEPGNLVNRGGLEPGAHVRTGLNNIVRPVHDVGLPIVSVPYFTVAWGATRLIAALVPQRVLARARLDPPLLFRHLLSLGMIVLTGAMARLLYGVLRASAPGRDAALWTLLFVLSPPLLSHSFLFFTELPAAAVATWLYAAILVRADTSRHSETTREVLIGTAIGFLPLLHVRLSGLAVGFALLHLSRRRRLAWRPLVAFFAPLFALVAFKLWLNERFWGTLLTSPQVQVGGVGGVWANLAVAAERLMALCFDQAHGLLPYAPLYLTVVPGTILLWRADRRRCLELWWLIASYLVPVALPALNAHGWQGGWSPAARFLVPIAPCLAILAFSCVAQRGRWSAALKVLVSVQVALGALYWSHPKLMWNDEGAASALLGYLSPPGWDLSRWFPAWSQPSSYTIILSAGALLAWVAVSILLTRRPVRQ